MKFIKSIPISDSHNMGIYELNSEAAEYFHKKYLLHMDAYSAYWLNNHDDITIASELRKENYEDLYETLREAELATNLVKAIITIEQLQSDLSKIHEETRPKPFDIEFDI